MPVLIVIIAGACAPQVAVGPGLTEISYDAVTRLDEPVVLPLIEDALPVVEVEVAGCGRARFLIDSASELTVLDQAFADRCGLARRRFEFDLQINTAGGVLKRLDSAAHVERISLGGASAMGLDAPLIDLSSLPFRLDGILGQDVLGDWALLFMAARRQLVILPSDGLLERLAEILPAGTPMESIAVHGSSRIANIAYHFDEPDFDVDLHVDTGATHTMLPTLALEALGARDGTPTESSTLAGKEARRAWNVSGFPLGTQLIDLAIRGTDKDTGLLGYDALRQRIFVVDGPGRRLLVEVPVTAR